MVRLELAGSLVLSVATESGGPSAKTASDCSKRRARAGRVALVTTWFALLWDLVFVGARHDLAQALRALVRAPGVTVGISLLLGLGVAATTTLFAFVDAVLLRPLPYDQPDRLVMMFESNVSQDRLREGASPGNILDWVERNDAFEAITAMMTVSATLRAGDGGTPIAGVHVTRGFFDVFRRQPQLGRTFQCGRIRRRGVDHVAPGVQRRTGDRAEPSPVADPRRRSAARRPDRFRRRPRLARHRRHARRLRRARRDGDVLGAVGHARRHTAARVFRTDFRATPGSCASSAA